MFLLVSCSFAFQYLFCAGSRPTDKRNSERKHAKETGEFPNQSHSINYDIKKRRRNYYFLVACIV